MLHRVLPSRVPRQCLTFWTYVSESEGATIEKKCKPFKPVQYPLGTSTSSLSTDTAPSSDIPLDEAVSLSLLLQPKLRPHFARLALARDWASSIVQAHAPSQQREAALHRHANEVAAIESSFVKFLVTSGLSGRAADPLALAEAHFPVEDESMHPGLVSWF
mmetsp:Transcript_77738/g.155699  ORF Transcript_77738/g.155699 Transcript_77738/m.155699 type:complete len:161 (+) Transcript_77738:580-1062(+)